MWEGLTSICFLNLWDHVGKFPSLWTASLLHDTCLAAADLEMCQTLVLCGWICAHNEVREDVMKPFV